MKRKWLTPLAALVAALLMGGGYGCGGGNSSKPLIEDLRGGTELSFFQLTSMRGARDGDRLSVQAMLSDTSSMLQLEMQFVIAAPSANLQSGSWQWNRGSQLEKGSVSAVSVTFLGGQSGPPSLGGTFELRDESGAPLYRVNLPTRELQPPAGR
jgi:hypothetical protein